MFVGYTISNLIKECNFDVVNFEYNKKIQYQMHKNSLISYVRVITPQVLRTKPKFIYFSGNEQSIISFTKSKNLLSLNC